MFVFIDKNTSKIIQEWDAITASAAEAESFATQAFLERLQNKFPERARRRRFRGQSSLARTGARSHHDRPYPRVQL